MILYFDNIITDVPLFKGVYSELDAIRDSNTSYKFRSRYEVTLYTLASYAEIEWSQVIIKYTLEPENKNLRREFESFVKKLWPKAHIIYGRSDNQKKFQESMNLINSFKDEWVFYAGNNDHPFIAPNKELLNKCLRKAKELKKKYKYVSVTYSHHPEPAHLATVGNAVHDIGFNFVKKLEETQDYVVALFPRGYIASDQISNKDVMNKYIFGADMKGASIKRIEAMADFVRVNNQVVVCPKE
jgi:hypothetical protein